VFGKKVELSRKISGPNDEKAEGGWVDGAISIIRNLVAANLHHA